MLDPECPRLWSRLRRIAAFHARKRPDLADEFDSAAGWAVVKLMNSWREGSGASPLTYATTIMHQLCLRAVEEARPLGYRHGRGGPSVRSLEALAASLEGLAVADLAVDPSPPPDARLEVAELAAVAMEAAGDDAPILAAWVLEGVQLKTIAGRLGVSPARAQQRAAAGLERARRRLGRAG
jgi:DNA-directed RNA polymerase specialized sigma24 family protein